MKVRLKNKNSIKKLPVFIIFASFVFAVFAALVPVSALAQISRPVGGKFLPGLVDIYTPDPFCGLLVSVIGPRPGVFTFAPVRIYNYFPQAPWHVGLNMLGLAGPPIPPCPPPLYMFGSGLTPGF